MATLNASVERLNIPPHSIDSEHAVLGALLLDNGVWDEVSDLLDAPDFYRGAHRAIWEAIAGLAKKGEPYDAVTVHDALCAAGQGEDVPLPYLGQLQAEVPSAANAASYAKTVRAYALRRAYIQTAERVKGLAYDLVGMPGEHLSDSVEKLVLAVVNRAQPDKHPSVKEILAGVVDRIDGLFEGSTAYTGVQTGFTDLDDLTCGLQASDLVILGGRPSMGKTALAINIAECAAIRDGVPTLVFSLEMSNSQLVTRLLSSCARIDSARLRDGSLQDDQWPRLTAAVAKVADAPLHINDTGALTPIELRSYARRMQREHGIGLIVVDYLQLMHGEGENRNLEISGISRSLKALAKELSVPVLALSQLNRGVEQRQDKRPVLADLRDSGSIEQDADLVMLVYRDEVYNRDSPDKGTAEVIVAKHRNGATGEVQLAWSGKFTRFDNHATS